MPVGQFFVVVLDGRPVLAADSSAGTSDLTDQRARTRSRIVVTAVMVRKASGGT